MLFSWYKIELFRKLNINLRAYQPFDICVRIPLLNDSLFFLPSGKVGHYIFPFVIGLKNFEPKTREFLDTVLQPGDCFIDVGAHIGCYPVLMARKVGFVIAVEPCLGKFLRKNLSLNRLENVFVSEKAAYHSRCCVQMASTGHYGVIHLPSQGHGKGSYYKSVQAAPLDEIVAEAGHFPRIKALKIDVDGAEFEVLAGASQVLEKTEYVIFEALDLTPQNVSNCIKLLKSKGFQISEIERYGDCRNLLAKKKKTSP
jgi:FkbM family methyltransferase